MSSTSLILALTGLAVLATPVAAATTHSKARRAAPVASETPGEGLSSYSNGYGTNAANSTSVGRGVDSYGGYVVNQYGFGNYVSGPQGYGGYPTGSAEAQIWKQRQEWKCQNNPESC